MGVRSSRTPPIGRPWRFGLGTIWLFSASLVLGALEPRFPEPESPIRPTVTPRPALRVEPKEPEKPLFDPSEHVPV